MLIPDRLANAWRRGIVPILLLVGLWATPAGAQDPAGAALQALIERGSYEQAEQLARVYVDALVDTHGDGSPEVAAASDLLVRALLLDGKAAAPTTLALAQRIVQWKEAQPAAERAGLLRSRLNLGDALIGAAEYEHATAIFQAAIADLHDGDAASLDLAAALDHLGVSLVLRDRADEAVATLTRSLTIKRLVLSPPEPEIAATLQSLAWALQRRGDYTAAGTAIREAAAIRAETQPDHPGYAETLSLLGLQQWFEGHTQEARDTSAHALAVAEATLPAEHPTIALALKRLGATLLDLGDVSGSLALKKRALDIAEQAFGARHFETWAYVNDLAESTRRIGDYANARVLYLRSLTIAETRFGPWHDSVATALHNLALVDASLGDYDKARREQLRAEATWARVLGPDHPFVAVALTELAGVFRAQGATTRAVLLLNRALAIRERSLGLGHRDVARTLTELGEANLELRRATRAAADAARALRIWEDTGGAESLDFAATCQLLARIETRRRHLVTARGYYEQALHIMQPALGVSHPSVAEVQVSLAGVLAEMGESGNAIALAATAESSGREHLRLMLGYLPERQSLQYAARRPEGLDLLLSLAGDSAAGVAIAFDKLIRSRALVLDEMAARRSAAAVDAGVSALQTQLAGARQRLANLVVKGPDALAAADYRPRVAQTRTDIEDLETRLAGQSGPFRDELSRSKIGLPDVRGALSQGLALVSIVRYQRTEFPAAAAATASTTPVSAVRRETSEAAYLAFVLRAGSIAPELVPLGAAADIESLVTEWRRELVAGLRVAPGASSHETTRRALGAALRDRIWTPISTRLGGTDRVYVVPDGALNLVPLAALPSTRGRYLLEDGPVIHYLSAERDLVVNDAAPPLSGSGLLAIGSPAFADGSSFAALVNTKPSAASSLLKTAATPGAQGPGLALEPTGPAESGAHRGIASDCVTFQSMRFEALPASGAEADAVALIWRQLSSENGAITASAKALLGAAATEGALKEMAPGQRILHIATHGFFLSDNCISGAPGTRSVGVLVRPGSASDLAASRTAAPARSRSLPENPLVLSGLALAGANRRAAVGADENDGILTAEEVASLNLAGVEWAVLSACDTGLGTVAAGEGVFGLRRAFQIAGVHTVIMSLWSVEDRATYQWMEALYTARLGKHLDTADAVRAASLALLHERRAKGRSTNPFYWAGFVAAGDWR